MPAWPTLYALDGQSLPHGARIIDASNGETYDAEPGSAVLPKRVLAALAAYYKGTQAFYDASQLCRSGK